MTPRGRSAADAVALITGGAGFIGTNLAARLATHGVPVRIFDNLQRDGVDANLAWLLERFGESIEFVPGDIRDADAVDEAVRGVRQVFHFAAQVAVTSSLDDPLHDFAVNAGGTLHVLEAIRRQPDPPSLLFTSTNKVYGDLEDLHIVAAETRYTAADAEVAQHGISEARPVEFHSPYGCSKGAADQYVLDYARTFQLPAAVFRMSCIYGPHQCGTEDQGWVAHFAQRALRHEPITIYGDGLQVRDLLFVEDLVDAMLLAQERMHDLAGEPFNIGGGQECAVSLVELLETLGGVVAAPLTVGFDAWRRADQRFYVSDTRKFRDRTGWTPHVSVESGVARLCDWLSGEFAQRTAEAAAAASAAALVRSAAR